MPQLIMSWRTVRVCLVSRAGHLHASLSIRAAKPSLWSFGCLGLSGSSSRSTPDRKQIT